MNLFRNKSKVLSEWLKKNANQYDAIIVDHYEVFQFVPKKYKGKIILHTHNAEFALWERMAMVEKNPIKKALIMIESKRVKAYERQLFDKADIVFCTPSDKEHYEKKWVP